MKLQRILLAAFLIALLRHDAATRASATPPMADLTVSIGSLPAQLQETDLLTVSITVSNLGPDAATLAQLGLNLDPHVVIHSISGTKISGHTNDVAITVQGSNVTCSVNTLAPRESFVVSATFSAIFDEIEDFELNLRAQASAAEAILFHPTTLPPRS